jgi:hypothetical protein
LGDKSQMRLRVNHIVIHTAGLAMESHSSEHRTQTYHAAQYFGDYC